MCTVVVSLRDMFGCAAGNVSEFVQEEKGSSCCSELERSYTGGLSWGLTARVSLPTQ